MKLLGPSIPAVERAKQFQGLPPSPADPHSVAVPGSKRQDGRTAVYRHWRFQDGLLRTLDDDVRTAHDMFESTANRVSKRPCLGHRPYDAATKTFGDYVWQDYQTIQTRRANFGVGLVKIHTQVGVTGNRYGVGLWCQNRPEWQITDLACMSQSLYTVSLYDTLGPEATEYIINHSKLVCVVTSVNHIPTLLKLKPRMPTLKLIVSLDPLDEGEQQGMSKADLLNDMGRDLGVSISYIKTVEAMGEIAREPFNPPTTDDIVTINYTSGTTGNPKAAVLTHGNAVAATSAALISLQVNYTDVICSYLPLAHIFQRSVEHSSLWAGGAIGYFHGVILELVEDMKLLRPTVFISVPRLYNRFGAAIKEATINQPGLKGALSRRAVSTKLENMKNPESGLATNKHLLYDTIWARKVTGAFGLDRCRNMVTGSAPIDPSLHQFLRIVFANNFVQGYGLTETYAVSMLQLGGDLGAGSCGAVAPSTEACLIDVPDMDYLTTDKPYPRGELLLRGHSRFREYLYGPEETAKAIDDEGWLHTGDICYVDARGRFSIIDRVKNVLKLAQGEYISPERIENVFLASCPWLATAFVHGDSHQSSLVGIFGIAPEAFARFVEGLMGEDKIGAGLVASVMTGAADGEGVRKLESLAQDVRVRGAVLAVLDKVARQKRFNGYEKVKAVRLLVEPFSVENELLTPTLKLKRPQTAKRYRKLIDEMYEEIRVSEEQRPVAKL